MNRYTEVLLQQYLGSAMDCQCAIYTRVLTSDLEESNLCYDILCMFILVLKQYQTEMTSFGEFLISVEQPNYKIRGLSQKFVDNRHLTFFNDN